MGRGKKIKDTNIGEIIKGFRKAAGMSQMKLAAKLGISYQQIQKYEKGASQLNMPRITQMSKALGVPLKAFFPEGAGVNWDDRITAKSIQDPREIELVKNFRRLPIDAQEAMLISMRQLSSVIGKKYAGRGRPVGSGNKPVKTQGAKKRGRPRKQG